MPETGWTPILPVPGTASSPAADVPPPRTDAMAYGGGPMAPTAGPAGESRAAGGLRKRNSALLPLLVSGAILALSAVAISSRARGAGTPRGIPSDPDLARPSDARPAEPGAAARPLATPESPAARDVALEGRGALEAAVLADDWVTAKGLFARGTRGIAFAVAAPGTATSARVRIGVVDGGIVLLAARAPDDEDPEGGIDPPSALVEPVLSGVKLAVTPAGRPAAVAALALLALRDGAAAGKVLAGAPPDAGVRVLEAYAALVAGDSKSPHAALAGLENDPEAGAVARFLTGAAMLQGETPKEAVRDFDAALLARPAFWPAAMLKGAAYEDLGLAAEAAEAYRVVLAGDPRQPVARLRLSALLAETDLAAATRDLQGLVAERPAFAGAWRALGEARHRGESADDVTGEVEAFERLAALRPKDPTAWDALGGAQARRAARGGGAEAYAKALEAYAQYAAVAPEEGLAWFNRGAVLLQEALDPAAGGGARSFRERLAEARTCFAKALARGLRRDVGARAQFDLGIVLDYRPDIAGGQGAQDLPATAAEAFEAAWRIDPNYVEAALALVAARVAAKDAAGAERALADVPVGAHPEVRAVLESTVGWVKGQGAGVAEAPAASRPAEKDPLAPLARSLILLGYRRTAFSLLDGDTQDATRLFLRARARAYLFDVEGLRADLDRLASVDRAAAEDLRGKDPVVKAALRD